MRKLIVFFILVFFTGIVLGNDMWVRVTSNSSTAIDFMKHSNKSFSVEGDRYHAGRFRLIKNKTVGVYDYTISGRDCDKEAGLIVVFSAATSKFIESYEFVIGSGNMASHVAELICFQAKHSEADL